MLLLGVALAAGCHSRESTITRTSTTDYQTVSEGAAQGGAATIAAPGEAAPPLLSTGPLSNTNVDTTTSLTISNTQTLPPNTGAPTLGGTMSGAYPTSATPPAPAPRPRPAISISRSPAPSTRTLSEDGGMTPSSSRDGTTQTLSPSTTTQSPAPTSTRDSRPPENPPSDDQQSDDTTSTSTAT